MSIEIIARETRKKKLTNRFGDNIFFNLKKLRFLFLGRIEKETIFFSKYYSYDVKETTIWIS